MPAFFSELLLLAVPVVVFCGVWLGPPLLAYLVGNIVYAAYARSIGIPKPEKGYSLADAHGGWLLVAFLAWSWLAYRLAVTNRPTLDGWIHAVDELLGT